jgi:hypothetical protein
MSGGEQRRRAARVRDLPLELVLVALGASRDQRDKSKWHTERGSLSITGAQFMNWRLGRGGGGAIDLVMQLLDLDYRASVEWLELHLAGVDVNAPVNSPQPVYSAIRGRSVDGGKALRMPMRDDGKLDRVLSYLTVYRRLESGLLAPLVESGMLYADSRGNAVFVLAAGKAKRPVGAELRGTGPRPERARTGATSGSAKLDAANLCSVNRP